jgi:hypothetical protein
MFRSGNSRAGTVVLFRVRWSWLEWTMGSVASQPLGRDGRFALAGERERMLERTAQQSILPPHALQAELHERGVKASCFGAQEHRQ